MQKLYQRFFWGSHLRRRRGVLLSTRPTSEVLTRVFFPQVPEVGPLARIPSTNEHQMAVLGGAITFLQKRCYQWQPRKCLGLYVVNSIVFLLKNGKRIPKNHIF
jgi:hypothetical protein